MHLNTYALSSCTRLWMTSSMLEVRPSRFSWCRPAHLHREYPTCMGGQSCGPCSGCYGDGFSEGGSASVRFVLVLFVFISNPPQHTCSSPPGSRDRKCTCTLSPTACSVPPVRPPRELAVRSLHDQSIPHALLDGADAPEHVRPLPWCAHPTA